MGSPFNKVLNVVEPARYLPIKQMVEVGFIGAGFFDLRF